MNSKQYQTEILRTLNTNMVQKEMVSMLCMGLTGEAGEVVELFKKNLYHEHTLSILKLKEELGDVLWYLSNIATTYNLSLEEIMDYNIVKLRIRYPKGFSITDSINRTK